MFMEGNSRNLRALVMEKRDVSVHKGEKSALKQTLRGTEEICIFKEGNRRDLFAYRGKWGTPEHTSWGLEGIGLCKEDSGGVPREHNEGNREGTKAA